MKLCRRAGDAGDEPVGDVCAARGAVRRGPGAVAAFVPALIAVTLGVIYLELANRPLALLVMQGARAGALAVFAWAVIRLVRPQLRTYGWRGTSIVAGTAGLMWVGTPTFLVLLIAGVLGAFALREVA